MFRRRTDFSWPLILVLVGLFFLSLKLPRQWERIARPTPLVLKPHKSLQAKELPSVASSQAEASPLEAFRSIKPAGYVAGNDDRCSWFRSHRLTTRRDRPWSYLSWSTDLPLSEVVPAAAPVEEPVKVAVAVEGSRENQTDKVLIPAPSTATQSILPSPG